MFSSPTCDLKTCAYPVVDVLMRRLRGSFYILFIDVFIDVNSSVRQVFLRFVKYLSLLSRGRSNYPFPFVLYCLWRSRGSVPPVKSCHVRFSRRGVSMLSSDKHPVDLFVAEFRQCILTIAAFEIALLHPFTQWRSRTAIVELCSRRSLRLSERASAGTRTVSRARAWELHGRKTGSLSWATLLATRVTSCRSTLPCQACCRR